MHFLLPSPGYDLHRSCQAAPIERLPPEIFDIIAAYLDLAAYRVIRLCSQQLLFLSFSSFAKRFFSSLTTTLGPPSLQCLLHVSCHPHLANVVAMLDIRLLNHCDYEILAKISRVGIFPPPKRFPKVSGVRPEHVSEEAKLYEQVANGACLNGITECLAHVLRRLKNLKTIRFRAHQPDSFGWRTAATANRDVVFRTRCFNAVLDAIIKSEIQLKEFLMAKSNRGLITTKFSNIASASLYMAQSRFTSLQHCFRNLESLTLAVISANSADSRLPGWENDVSNFVAAAPSIHHLSLNLDPSGFVTHYSTAVLHSLSLKCRLPELGSLHLINCSVGGVDLERLVLAHAKSLKHIALSEVHLAMGSWLYFFASMKTLEGLQTVRLVSLQEAKRPVYFRHRNGDRPKVTLDKQKTQRPMSDLLGDLNIATHTTSEHFPTDSAEI